VLLGVVLSQRAFTSATIVRAGKSFAPRLSQYQPTRCTFAQLKVSIATP